MSSSSNPSVNTSEPVPNSQSPNVINHVLLLPRATPEDNIPPAADTTNAAPTDTPEISPLNDTPVRSNSDQRSSHVPPIIINQRATVAARSLCFPPVSPDDIVTGGSILTEAHAEYIFSKGYDSDGELPFLGDLDGDIEKLDAYNSIEIGRMND